MDEFGVALVTEGVVSGYVDLRIIALIDKYHLWNQTEL